MTSSRSMTFGVCAGVSLAFALAGCSDDRPRGILQGAANGDGSTGDASAGMQDSGAETGDASTPADAGGSDGKDAGASQGGEDAGQDAGPKIVECGAVVLQPELGKPVDIVWAIDNSGSMDDEAAAVASNLVSFADALAASSLDYRLVVISQSGFVPEYAQLAQTLPVDRFLFVDENVQSPDPLPDLLKTFDSYSSVLRESAVTHFVAVTDDEACNQQIVVCLDNLNPAARAAQFQTDMEARLGHDFFFHSIVSPEPTCAGASRPGLTYEKVSEVTGGRTFEICAADWSSLFDELGSAVDESAKVSCSIELPKPPDGLALNPERVSLNFELDGAMSTLGRVATGDVCDAGDWYYDRPLLPQLIELCPARCQTLQSTPGAKLEVTLECGSNACAGVSTAAKLFSTPVDVVWVVDSSDSMVDEMQKVSANLTSFSDALAQSGIDYRVIVVRAAGAALTLPDGDRFFAVDAAGTEANVLGATVANFPAIAKHLRSGALSHWVFVSNDETQLLDGTGPVPPAAVTTTVDQLIATLSGPALLGKDFVAHAVASEDPTCMSGSSAAVSPGRTLYELANKTGGTTFSICADDWGALADSLSKAVVTTTPIDCHFDLPKPPMGQVFNAEEVNVRFAYAGAAQPVVVGNTPADKCEAGGWFYDDPMRPSTVELCPSTCEEVQGKVQAAIDIELGCKTEVIILE